MLYAVGVYNMAESECRARGASVQFSGKSVICSAFLSTILRFLMRVDEFDTLCDTRGVKFLENRRGEGCRESRQNCRVVARIWANRQY